MMDPLRTAGLWLGVGAGHAVALAVVWGSGAGRLVDAHDPACLQVVWVVDGSVADAQPASSGANLPAVAAVAAPVVAATRSAPPPAGPAVSPASVSVGGDAGQPVETGVEPPRFLDRVEPLYPRAARLAGIEGAVRLRLAIGADGAVHGSTVLSGSGEPSLDRAAEAAARSSTYLPARVGGRPVAAEVEASYRFELR